jgi:Predicted transcriptional regulators
MDKQKMGNFLNELRKEKNMTQSDLSNVLNLSPQAISRWESGDSIPDIDTLEKLAKFYGVSIEEIINGEKKKQEPIIIENVSPKKEEKVNKLDLKKDLFSFIFGVSIFIFMVCIYFGNFYNLPTTIGNYHVTIVLTGYKILFETTGLMSIFIWLYTVSAIISTLMNIGLWLSKNKKPFYITRLISSIISIIFLTILHAIFSSGYDNTTGTYAHFDGAFYVLTLIYVVYFILILVLPYTNRTHFLGKKIKKENQITK